MNLSFPPQIRQSIQQSLQELALQMGQTLERSAAEQLYQDASELLNSIACEPLTLARVAGILLVYQMQNIEPEELEWFKSQLRQYSHAEEVEELIESIHRVDSL